jgi:signal transduction histidine kinase
MRLPLRWKILLITVITPLSLGLAALVSVHRNVQRHVDSSSIHESLEHSVRVFEGMLSARGRALGGGAEVIARDPRFFSLLTLGPGQRDSRFTATVRGMARDFNAITRTEVFEVMDARGRRLASVGPVASAPASRDSLVRLALRGRAVVSVMVHDGLQYQVSVTPVRSDRRIVGVLLLGSEVGDRLARELRGQMRSEVTFVAGGRIVSTTLERAADREALLGRLADLAAPRTDGMEGFNRVEVRGGGLTYVTIVRPLPGSEPGARQLYVMQRAKDPETDFLHQMQRDLGMLGIVGVLAALITGIMLSGNITRPIQQLVRGAQEMQRGNYTHPVQVNSRDEIGFLADRFNEMRHREQVYVSSLEEAARLKSEFITVASHELRTPISVIQGYRDLLACGGLGDVPAPQLQALDAIKGSLQKLTRIADQATLVAQVQGERLALDVRSQPVAPVVERAVGEAQAASAGRRVRIETHVAKGLEPFDFDGELLALALTNLISNGIRFTPDGGVVSIDVREHERHLEIHVTDDGPGIPEDRVGRIFEHGYSINDSLHHHSSAELEFNSRGLGLGLGITRGIVEAHGGTVSASNRIEGGSRFLVRIPRYQPNEEQRVA